MHLVANKTSPEVASRRRMPRKQSSPLAYVDTLIRTLVYYYVQERSQYYAVRYLPAW